MPDEIATNYIDAEYSNPNKERNCTRNPDGRNH